MVHYFRKAFIRRFWVFVYDVLLERVVNIPCTEEPIKSEFPEYAQCQYIPIVSGADFGDEVIKAC